MDWVQMRRIFLRVLLLGGALWTSSADAQVHVGIRVNPSVGYLRARFDDTNEVDSNPYVGLGAGLFVQVGDPQSVRFFAEAEYQPKRIKYESPETDEKENLRMQYVVLGPGIRFFTPDLFVGGRLMMDMSARAHLRAYEHFINDQGPLLDKTRAVELSLRWGIGAMIDWRDHVSFFAMIGYERGLTNLARFKEELTMNTQRRMTADAFSLGIGIMF